MEPSAEADSWAAYKVRHFRRLLFVASALFLATEVTAFFGVVPHLRPVSLQDLSANILFAIGFGCPFVLYLSNLPRLRELAGTLTLGGFLALGIWQIHRWTGLPDAYKPEEVVVAETVTGLGLASLGILCLRAWRGLGRERTAALLFLLPASVSLFVTVEAGIFLFFIESLLPTSYDPSAYAADAAYGAQWGFAVGRLFEEVPLLRFVCFTIYVAPPPALVFVYFLQRERVGLRPSMRRPSSSPCSWPVTVSTSSFPSADRVSHSAMPFRTHRRRSMASSALASPSPARMRGRTECLRCTWPRWYSLLGRRVPSVVGRVASRRCS